MKLQNKIALITGASRGIGRSIAISLAKEGCTVIVNFKTDLDSAQSVVKECNQFSQNNLVLQADVSSEEEVKKMFEEVKNKFSHLDILINNAGIFDENDSFDNLDAFENTYKNNFLSSVMAVKYAVNLMDEGKIINISSIHGRLGHGRPSAIAYSAFKTAIDSYTKNLAKALAPKILVNAVAPGRVLTPMWGNLSDHDQKELGQGHLIKRMINPEEIADTIVFILKNDAVCGEILTIDGGHSLHSIE